MGLLSVGETSVQGFLVYLLDFCLFSFFPSSLQMQTRNVWVKLWNRDSFSEAR